MVSKITFGIKTFKRYDCLNTLLKSIQRFYPKAKIIITDDSDNFNKNFYTIWKRELNVKVVKMPFDSGLSAGRNKMVELCDTEYFLLLDDDFIFTEETNIEKFFNIIESDKKIGVVGGCCIENNKDVHYEHLIEIKNGILYQLFDGDNWEDIKGIKAKQTGCVLNFGLFRTKMFKDILWDENLKLAEHTDFYIRMLDTKWKTYYTPEVKIIHTRYRQDNNYKQYRARGLKYSIMMFKKHKIKKQITINGVITELSGDRLINKRLF